MRNRQSFAPRLTRLMIPLMLLAVVAFTGGVVMAQGGTPQKIRIGETVTGTLNAEQFAQVYTFDGEAGRTISITATSQTESLRVALILSDADGNIVARSSNLTGPETAISGVNLTASRPYYVTVLRATGAQGDASGTFSLALTGDAGTSVPTEVTLARGMSITLSWSTTDDLDIEVRDPVGGSVYFDNREVPSGGSLNRNTNEACENTSRSASETVSWGPGSAPAGSYEVLVYFNRVCETQASAVQFTAAVTVDGTALAPVTGSLNLNEQYVFSYVLASPSNVSLRQGGANPLLINLTPFTDQLSRPIDLAGRTTVQGRITNQSQVDVWAFQGTAGAVVTVDMVAILGGSLDPQLILIDEQGNVVDSNDDANRQTRNARIENKTLPATGRYRIVATRFGKNIGGTEGSYQLTVTGAGSGTTAAVTPGAATTPVAQPTSSGIIAGMPTGSINISLTWNNRADMRILVRDPQNRSLFSDVRQVTGGGILERIDNLNCQNLTTTPSTYAYWPNDPPLIGTYEVQVWMNNQCSEPTPPTFTLVVSVRGQEIIREVNRPDLTKNITVFTFTVDAQGSATATKGGIFTRQLGTDVGDISTRIPDAENLVYGRAVAGVIDATTPYVVYTFQARAGDRLRIGMRSITGTLDPFLYLLDSAGFQIAANDDVQAGQDANSRIDAVIPADGAYIVVASRFGAVFGGTSGTYELSISPLTR
ncbi:MAG: PPC domain-containing protein [Anaerolineae bacterium]|nr:PPC domain-containing protein [Anaerolineae bacterium]